MAMSIAIEKAMAATNLPTSAVVETLVRLAIPPLPLPLALALGPRAAAVVGSGGTSLLSSVLEDPRSTSPTAAGVVGVAGTAVLEGRRMSANCDLFQIMHDLKKLRLSLSTKAHKPNR